MKIKKCTWIVLILILILIFIKKGCYLNIVKSPFKNSFVPSANSTSMA